jgi:hypothetical protein
MVGIAKQDEMGNGAGGAEESYGIDAGGAGYRVEGERRGEPGRLRTAILVSWVPVRRQSDDEQHRERDWLKKPFVREHQVRYRVFQKLEAELYPGTSLELTRMLFHRTVLCHPSGSIRRPKGEIPLTLWEKRKEEKRSK